MAEQQLHHQQGPAEATPVRRSTARLRLAGTVCWDERHANMTNPRKPQENLTAAAHDPRRDGVPTDISVSQDVSRVSPRSPAGQRGVAPVWSLASRTASLAAPAATFGARAGATTAANDIR
jgi:hypothetical protein